MNTVLSAVHEKNAEAADEADADADADISAEAFGEDDSEAIFNEEEVYETNFADDDE